MKPETLSSKIHRVNKIEGKGKLDDIENVTAIQAFYANFSKSTRIWRKVTCKNCLKQKPKKSSDNEVNP